MKFHFGEMGSDGPFEQEPGFKEFRRTAAMSGDATERSNRVFEKDRTEAAC
jgi:hypothetical protein